MFNPDDTSYTMDSVALMDLCTQDYSAAASGCIIRAVTEQWHQVVSFSNYSTNMGVGGKDERSLNLLWFFSQVVISYKLMIIISLMFKFHVRWD